MPEDGTAPETLDAERVSRLLLRYLDEGKETRSVLQEILVTLRQSNIVPRGDETKWVRFWNKYNQEADEYDREFLQRYKEDMNTTMIFSGLFTAVTATIASMTISNLSQDPNLFTQVLLHNIFVSLNHTGEFIHMDIPLSPWTGPSVSVVWSQTFLYASLVCSLLVALGAVLATQWLSRYNAVDERGTVEDRGKRRQQKFDGLKTWYFRTFLEALPILLQFSLLLFGISLCAYMWAQQRAIAAILIFANGLAGLLWLYTVVVSAIYPESPYDTPLSDLLAAKRVKGRGYNGGPTSALVSSIRLSGIFNAIREHIQTAYSAIIAAATAGVHGRVNERPHSLRRDVVRTERTDLEQAGSPAHTAATRIHLIQPLRNGLTTIYARVSPPVRHVSHYVAHNSIGILSRISAPIVNTHKKRLARSYPTINDVRIAAFTWLLQTSTDPEVHINAFLIVPEMVWTDEMFTNSFSLKSLDFILDKLVSCFDWDGRPKSDSFDRTVSLLTTFLFVYWQLYRTSPDRTHAWTREKGRAFASGRAAIVDTLRSLDLTTYSRSASETWVLRHAYLTFQHFTETRSPLKLVQVNFAISTSSLSQVSATYLESPPSSPFTASLRLRTFSLLYLAQASHVGAWWDQSRGVLFAQIEEYFDALAVENTRSFSLLATALILGYETQQIVTPDWSHSVDWPSAVGCVLLEMWGYVQWRAYEDESGDLPPFAFTQEPAREVHLSKASLILLSRILRILHSAVPTLPESWTPPSSRCEWLSLLVHRLCTSEEVAREVVYRGRSALLWMLLQSSSLNIVTTMTRPPSMHSFGCSALYLL
ncbi:hypothetical protein BXZ70DRAFT_772982 [Cristinia sonorae]|uniref:DUF6535 domain-containing protein n=1 Tax=Cristinia sonorae TaxID=1940300 RepID=A0A8K0UUV2_9AGAR|nr:hypothetical protein BXZ70DRAFT_772982 [Cristinia sonorae]